MIGQWFPPRRRGWQGADRYRRRRRVLLIAAAASAQSVAPAAVTSTFAAPVSSGVAGRERPDVGTAAPLAQSVTPSFNGRYPVASSDNDRYLVDQSGDPWFAESMNAWTLVLNLSDADITTFLEGIAAKSFNSVTFTLFGIDKTYEGSVSTKGLLNVDGESVFTGTPFQSPLNDAYFQRVDHVFNESARLGIVPVVQVGYGGFGGTDGVRAEMEAASNEQMIEYGVAIATRYADRPYIIWQIGADDGFAPTDPIGERYEAIEEGISSVGNWLLHAHPGSQDAWGFRDGEAQFGSGYSFNEITTNGVTRPEINAMYTWQLNVADRADGSYTTVTKPLWFVETVFSQEEEHWPGDENVNLRRSYWAFVLRGGMGYTYGANAIWHFDAGGFEEYTGTWRDALDDADINDVKILWDLIDADPGGWVELAPDDGTFVIAQEPADAERTAASYSDALGLVYKPQSSSITVDLSVFPFQTARVRWLDPSDGTYQSVGEFSTDGAQVFSDPGNNSGDDPDWVLVVDESTGASIRSNQHSRQNP